MAVVRPKGEENGSPPPVLVLGVGNLLLGDDGVGVWLVRKLQATKPPWGAEVEVVDGGTAGIALLGLWEGRQGVLLVDAVRGGLAPGAARLWTWGEMERWPGGGGLSPHEGSAMELVRAAYLLGELPPHLQLFGVEPADVDTRVGLSPLLEAAVPRLLQELQEALAVFIARVTRKH